MRRLTMLAASAIALAVIACPAFAQTATAGKCEPDTLSKTLHERMKKEGKTDAEIGDILGSSFKRKILLGRVSDGSGCSSEQTDKALQVLATTIKHG